MTTSTGMYITWVMEDTDVYSNHLQKTVTVMTNVSKRAAGYVRTFPSSKIKTSSRLRQLSRMVKGNVCRGHMLPSLLPKDPTEEPLRIFLSLCYRLASLEKTFLQKISPYCITRSEGYAHGSNLFLREQLIPRSTRMFQ